MIDSWKLYDILWYSIILVKGFWLICFSTSGLQDTNMIKYDF